MVHNKCGSVYTSWVFRHRLRNAGLRGSRGRVANPVDNTTFVSSRSTMQRELLDTQRRARKKQPTSAISESIEALFAPTAGTPASATLGPPSS